MESVAQINQYLKDTMNPKATKKQLGDAKRAVSTMDTKQKALFRAKLKAAKKIDPPGKGGTGFNFLIKKTAPLSQGIDGDSPADKAANKLKRTPTKQEIADTRKKGKVTVKKKMYGGTTVAKKKMMMGGTTMGKKKMMSGGTKMAKAYSKGGMKAGKKK
jgi:ribosome-interacting GTPase 1|tara:strand:- start:30 stop:506 length:477 start_codon:yes stop_codon:yes gene_type:complete